MSFYKVLTGLQLRAGAGTHERHRGPGCQWNRRKLRVESPVDRREAQRGSPGCITAVLGVSGGLSGSKGKETVPPPAL